MTTTQAPNNNLPSWEECKLRVDNSDYIEKRQRDGGTGPKEDSKTASELHRFIYEYDDADEYRSKWFMHNLECVVQASERIGYERAREDAAKACEERAQNRFLVYGTRESDTNASYYSVSAANRLEAQDEEDESCAAAIRSLKP